MQTVSFHLSAVPPGQLGGIMTDYLALDRVRMLRRLLMRRCGSLALVVAAYGGVFHRLTPVMSWFSFGLCLIPPAWAWGVELRHHRQLARRIELIRGAAAVAVKTGGDPSAPAPH